eukprot:403367142
MKILINPKLDSLQTLIKWVVLQNTKIKMITLQLKRWKKTTMVVLTLKIINQPKRLQ